ncbi:MAG: NAD-dependent epimerase/dehydratase family protein, partial [Lachnospiraceae bacterium]|nr:NAD-dependent epimerase/dehydratase family protein [Lachnospiraceae bacterium]
MNIIILGAAGFIGTNLSLALATNPVNELTLVDTNKSYFSDIADKHLKNVKIVETNFTESTNFDELLKGNDVVYHLISTTAPTTSNQQIAKELNANVVMTSIMLDSCIRQKIKKIVFLSSGGTVYGRNVTCPINETDCTNPISSYGIQKLTIEKLLYLYNYMYGLDYRIIRLANPYGPYQRPNGILGAVTTFTYKAINEEIISVYGDGSVVRDFIYIDDAIKAILNIVNGENEYKLYNVGCGYGTSIKKLLSIIEEVLCKKLKIEYRTGRPVDVPVNFLDISRYE